MTLLKDTTDVVLLDLWRGGKLDCLCPKCGAGMAATSWCYRCFTPLAEADIRVHVAGQPCLASGRSGRVGGVPVSRAREQAIWNAGAPEAPAVVSVHTQMGAGL